MRHRATIRRGGGAFTLVELLVVITILAVLAALLLPSLASAKARAKAAQCSHNLKELGSGWALYLNEHNGYYPYQAPVKRLEEENGIPGNGTWDTGTGQFKIGGVGWALANMWQFALAPYAGLSGVDKYGNGPFSSSYYSIMRCPSNPWKTSNFNDANEYYFGTTGAGGGTTYSYSLNKLLIPVTPWSTGSVGNKYDSPSGWTKRANMNDIQHPATSAMMLENPLCPSRNGLVDTPWQYFDNFIRTQPMPFLGGSRYDYGGIGPTYYTNLYNCVDHGEERWLRDDCNYMVSVFHNLSANVLFFDGHVERLSKSVLLSHAVQAVNSSMPNGSPGGMFWTDGFGGVTMNCSGAGSKYSNQFPGTAIYP